MQMFFLLRKNRVLTFSDPNVSLNYVFSCFKFVVLFIKITPLIIKIDSEINLLEIRLLCNQFLALT